MQEVRLNVSSLSATGAFENLWLHLTYERYLAGEHLATSPRICIAFFNS